MKDYTKHIKTQLTEENNYSCFGFSYMFDLSQGFPNFDNLFELNQLVGPDHFLLTHEQAEIDAQWLLSGDKDLDLLHQQNAHWRNYLGFECDYEGLVPLSLESRVNLAITKLKEEDGLEFDDNKSLMCYLIETYDYPQDGNLNLLLDNLDIPKHEKEILYPKGTVGDNHGLCFHISDGVNIHFQSSRVVDQNLFVTKDLESRVKAMADGKLSYTPNPVLLSSALMDMTPEDRISYITNNAERYSELLIDLDNWSNATGTPSEFSHYMKEKGLTPVKGEPLPMDAVLEYVDHFQKGVPSKAMISFLTLSEFDPVIDYGREVLSFLKCLEKQIQSSEIYCKGLGLYVHNAYFKDKELGLKLIDLIEQN